MDKNIDVIQEIKIEIIPEFKNLVPALKPEEYQNLEQAILEDGCRDAIVLWNSIIVDGHNRYEICTKHNIEFKTVQINFNNDNEAKAWMLFNVLAKRNLEKIQYALVRIKYEELIKEINKENERLSKGRGIKGRKKENKEEDEKGPQTSADLNEDNTVPKEDDTSKNNNSKKDTVLSHKKDRGKKLTKLTGASHDTVRKVKKIKEDPDAEKIIEQILLGEITINKAYKSLGKPHASQNTGENEWYTPKKYIDAALKTMGSIDLDPASTELANQIIKATKIFTKENSGLDKPWHGNVWLNPPYAQPLMTSFCDKLLEELSNISQACVLVNNATETSWFQKLVIASSSHCLIKHRIKFLDVDGNAGAPLQGQIILYFGSDLDKFNDNFNIFGPCGVIMTKKKEVQ